MDNTYYEAYLCKDGNTEIFLFALKDLRQAEDLVMARFKGCQKSDSRRVTIPYVKITSRSFMMENPIELFFCIRNDNSGLD